MNERWRESMYNIILAYYFRRILPELIIYHNKRILDRGIGYPTILPRVVICHLYFCDYNIFRRGTRKCSSCFLLVTRFPPYRDWHRKHIIFAENHHLLQGCLFLTTIRETSFSDSGRQSAGKAKMGRVGSQPSWRIRVFRLVGHIRRGERGSAEI